MSAPFDHEETDRCGSDRKCIILPVSVFDTICHLDDYPHQSATVSLKALSASSDTDRFIQLKFSKDHYQGTLSLEFTGTGDVFFDRNGTLSCSLPDHGTMKVNELDYREDSCQTLSNPTHHDVSDEDIGFQDEETEMEITAQDNCEQGEIVNAILEGGRTCGHCYMCDQTLQDDSILMLHLQTEHGLQPHSCHTLLQMEHSPKRWHYYIASHGNLENVLQKIDKNDPSIHACPLCGRERQGHSIITHLKMWHPSDSNMCELTSIMETQLKYKSANEFSSERIGDEEALAFKMELEALKKENILERRKIGYCYLCDGPCFTSDKDLLLHIQLDHHVSKEKVGQLITKKPLIWLRFAQRHGFKESSTITPKETQQDCRSQDANGLSHPLNKSAQKECAKFTNQKEVDTKVDEPVEKKRLSDRSHPCPLCGRSRYRQSLFRHLELWHATEPALPMVIENMKGLLDGKMLLKPLSDTKDKNEKSIWKKSCPFCKMLFKKYRSFYFKHVYYGCHKNPNRTLLYQCQKCPYVTKNNEEYQTHRKIHPPTRIFICEMCGVSYASRCHYLMHKKQKHNIEIEEKKDLHKCIDCGKEFFYENQLARHQFKHSEERRYQCDLCGHKSKTLANLKAHQKTQHQNIYKYVCSTCGHGVEKKKYLDAHVCGRVRRRQEQGASDGPSVSRYHRQHQAEEPPAHTQSQNMIGGHSPNHSQFPANLLP